MNAKHLLTAAILLCTNLALAQSFATRSFETRSIVTADLPKNAPAHTMHISNPVQSITKAEARAARIAMIVDNFERIDANGDGVVTRDELRTFLLANRRHAPMT